MKKVAFISAMGGVPWGGSEELWSRTATRLVRAGLKVGVNVPKWPEPVRQVEALAALGCEVERRERPSPIARLANRGLRSIGATPFVADPCKWLDRFQPDLVLVSQGCPIEGIDWLHACTRRRIPYGIIIQAAGERFSLDDSTVDEFAPLFGNARACYFVSESNRRFLERQLAIPLTNAKVVRNPFNVPYDAAPTWPTDNDTIKLACVARLDVAFKGQDILFELLNDVKWRERPIQVTLFGDGPNRRTLEALREMYCLKNVDFGGFSNDVEAIWRDYHGLILPSRLEGLPLAIIEAMLCQRVCIVTDVAGNAEAVEDNVTGFVAAAPTHNYLDEAMERAWQRRAEWPEIGQAGGRRVRELVPSDPAGVFADEIVSLFQRIVAPIASLASSLTDVTTVTTH
jgi:glycosyltransferase involved in cell wall biosynthesis